MRRTSGKLKRGEWRVDYHDDGTVSLGVVISGIPTISRRGGRPTYRLADVEVCLPEAVECDGMRIRPKLIVKLLASPTQKQLDLMRWGIGAR